MHQPKKNDNERFTYADYLVWLANERWEIIDGVAFAMSPSPGLRHQDLVLAIGSQLKSLLHDSPCRVIVAPFDVRLSEQQGASDNYIETVV